MRICFQFVEPGWLFSIWTTINVVDLNVCYLFLGPVGPNIIHSASPFVGSYLKTLLYDFLFPKLGLLSFPSTFFFSPFQHLFHLTVFSISRIFRVWIYFGSFRSNVHTVCWPYPSNLRAYLSWAVARVSTILQICVLNFNQLRYWICKFINSSWSWIIMSNIQWISS